MLTALKCFDDIAQRMQSHDHVFLDHSIARHPRHVSSDALQTITVALVGILVPARLLMRQE